jgi:hypothetical protein
VGEIVVIWCFTNYIDDILEFSFVYSELSQVGQGCPARAAQGVGPGWIGQVGVRQGLWGCGEVDGKSIGIGQG